MENGCISEDNINKMGATSNNNAARITTLQDRKTQIEETLAKRNQELRQLCIQEAELTGITPPEMPLEPGETLPLIRRQIGTSFQLPENLVKNTSNKDELIADLELQLQLHANMAEAALGLANEQNLSKTIKRQHRSEYQKHKGQCIVLQEKLALLKERAATEQHKQKKKSHVPEIVEYNISSPNTNNYFIKSSVRHSMRSTKSSLPSPSESHVELRSCQESPKLTYRNSEMPYIGSQTIRPEELPNSGFYRLSLNGYNKYMERREKMNNLYPSSNYSTPSSLYQYNSEQNTHMQHFHHNNFLTHYQQQISPNMPQHNSVISQHSPHMAQRHPVISQSHISPQLLQHNHQLAHLSRVNQHIPHIISHHSPQQLHHIPRISPQHSSQQLPNYQHYSQDYTKLSHVNPHFSDTHLYRQSSPTLIPPKSQYYSSHTIHGRPTFRHQNDGMCRSPHQIEPHQQYEQMNPVTNGLGGCWKKAENGELLWCNSNTLDTHWQRDKRFGSLDRGKHRAVSPNVDNKSATLAVMPNYMDQVRSSSVKSTQVLTRRSQDIGKLVRTQSLGSVGAQTVDSIYPSDDNSSYGSDSCGFDVNQTLRKHKEKEWLETSLDGPVSPAHSIISSNKSNSTVLSPEQKYVVHMPPPLPPQHPPQHSYSTQRPPQHMLPPLNLKHTYEIPAESNPSPKLPDTNIERFNNNVPKNCTIVQAGHCKPYHEETKPFEMSDFYKYSTKFKKSPVKAENESCSGAMTGAGNRSSPKNFDNSPKSPYLTKSHSASNIDMHNTNLEPDQIAVTEHFSAEMNAWYKDKQKHNNNSENTSYGRSTATLV